MPLVWVTGNSGVGKTTVCRSLLSRGWTAIEADWDGYSRWVVRASGQVVDDPPYPVPPGWLDRFAWRIDRTHVEELRVQTGSRTVFLCGSAENEGDVRDLFDLLLCLVVNDDILRHRLRNRTTNAFGKNPEELTVALAENAESERAYRRLGATIIDGARSAVEVADAVIDAARVIRS